ncbi:MAG: hypothetical protein JW772_00140 [Candidatus Diapherotrites archaeon]|nr:hypothetical protein [Candidatus Diapherotrites archaeon]
MGYPKELGDIIIGLLFSGLAKEQIFEQLSKDCQLKNSLAVDNEQIESAIEDSFCIFST